ERLLDLGKITQGRGLLLLAVVVDEGVLHDLEQPRLEVGPLLELVVVAVCLEVGLLNQILGVLRVARHSIGGVVQRVHKGHRRRLEVPPFLVVCAFFRHSVPLRPSTLRSGNTHRRCQRFTGRQEGRRAWHVPCWRQDARGLSYGAPSKKDAPAKRRFGWSATALAESA